jgi:hypothetical protein
MMKPLRTKKKSTPKPPAPKIRAKGAWPPYFGVSRMVVVWRRTIRRAAMPRLISIPSRRFTANPVTGAAS